jgi:hypothetical protein
MVPAALVQDLHEAAPRPFADVWVDGTGFNLNFPQVDVDLYVPGGGRVWHEELDGSGHNAQ